MSSFLFFLQLRIADEFKDFEKDSRYRHYRPVPRGLLLIFTLVPVGRFLRKPVAKGARLIEQISRGWMLLIY